MGAGRISELDGVRGIAACGVAFLVHFFQVGGVRGAGPLPELFGWVYAHGGTFVDLFFVLSGFVLTHACADTPAKAFAVNRFARLYPLHLATLILAGALLWVGGALYGGLPLDYGTAQIVTNLLLVQAAVVDFNFNAASWSISVEAMCYVLFALTIRSRMSLWWCAAFIAMGLSGLFNDWISRGLVGFFVGAALYRAAPRLARVPAWLLVLPALPGLVLIEQAWTNVRVDYLASSLVVWPWVLLAAMRGTLRLALRTAPLQWLGERSYGIYMLHTPVHLTMLLLNGGQFFAPALWPVAFCTAITATLVAADLSYRFLETPARRSLRRWARPAAPAPVA